MLLLLTGSITHVHLISHLHLQTLYGMDITPLTKHSGTMSCAVHTLPYTLLIQTENGF